MKHGSLFSGIGGFDLAAQWMNWDNVFHCENNPFCQRLLHHYWPNAKSYADIKQTDFTPHTGKIDILSGGFPCQPYSLAGKRNGKADSRHLWPEMLRAIREIQPVWIVGENVRGLTNWNEGLVFDEIQADLETEGFEVLPFLLPASAVNAPHRRDRIWIIAHANSSKRHLSTESKEQEEILQAGRNGTERIPTHSNGIGYEKRDKGNRLPVKTEYSTTPGLGNTGNASHSGSSRQQGQGRPGAKVCAKENGHWQASWAESAGRWPLESPLCSRNDGLSTRLDGITLYNWRQQSLMAAGNAIVPQVAYQIFSAIQQYNHANNY